MVYNEYTKQRILFYLTLGLSSYQIQHELRNEGCKVTRQGIAKFVKRYHQRGTITRKPGSGRPTKITEEVLKIVEDSMLEDDETTAVQLHAILSEKGVSLSLKTILRSRAQLGWTFRGSAYCQLIRNINKEKRLAWASKYVDDATNSRFENVIWSDETSIQVESHRRFCCRKVGHRPKPKPRPKHPVKVHVWGGISWYGRTSVVIFEGIMDAVGYTKVLEKGLLPFIKNTLQNHRFMQDNDPKHTSKIVGEFLEKNQVNWWSTPAESPDINPIENLWHEMKEFVRREVKPKTKSELIEGILQFWDKVDVVKCRRYIRHLRKVVPKIIECDGGPTGY